MIESYFVSVVEAAFLWFYCLREQEMAVVLLLMTVCFLLLNRTYKSRRSWHVMLCCICIMWSCVIIAATLVIRTFDSTRNGIDLIPFHSYIAVLSGETTEILRSNFMNVVLFYPVGLLLEAALPQSWKPRSRGILITVLCTVISIGIELCQYCYALGTAEIDDVIHNTLGAVLGFYIGRISLLHEKK